MTFQRARNEEQRQIRLKQITQAMLELMQDLPFDKITMKKVGEKLSFTRNNLYQYVKSKNEIMLLIIQQDFVDWSNDLQHIYQDKTSISLNEFCHLWIQTAVKYPRIFHWFPLLGELIEQDVAVEKLVPFKKSFFEVLQNTSKLIADTLDCLNVEQAERLIYFHLRVLSHLFHLYHECESQKKAIEIIGYPEPKDTFEQAATDELMIYIDGLKTWKKE